MRLCQKVEFDTASFFVVHSTARNVMIYAPKDLNNLNNLNNLKGKRGQGVQQCTAITINVLFSYR